MQDREDREGSKGREWIKRRETEGRRREKSFDPFREFGGVCQPGIPTTRSLRAPPATPTNCELWHNVLTRAPRERASPRVLPIFLRANGARGPFFLKGRPVAHGNGTVVRPRRILLKGSWLPVTARPGDENRRRRETAPLDSKEGEENYRPAWKVVSTIYWLRFFSFRP